MKRKKQLALEVDAIHEHLDDASEHIALLLNALKLDVESLHIRLDRAEACVGEPDEPDEPLPDKMQAQVSRKLAEFNKRLGDTLPEYETKLVATRLAVGELGRKLDDLTMRLDRAEPYWGAKVNPTEPLPDESCQEEIPWEGMPCLYGKKLDIVCCVITRGGDAACATATSTKDKPEHASDLHDAAFWGARYVLTARARHRSVSDKRDKRL
jgi:hypothetical protein